jgi:ribosome biogenesis GTPase / thiamine phosphate phosphatase
VFDLHALGFGPHFEQQLQSEDGRQPIPARIAAEHRGAYDVWAESGAGPARLAGRLRHELEQRGLPGVGDWVALRNEPGPDRAAVVDRVLTRRTVFTRGAAGREARVQIVAANVDLVFVVCGLDADFNVRRIERYLARIWASGAQPIVILNKADVCAEPAARVAEVERQAVGVPVHAISALHAADIGEVRARVRPGVTVALAGSSGAGKSTLVNALLGEERMATGAVRESDGRGRHVTTRRQLVLLPGGGLLLDTPGMRELQLVDPDGLDAAFEDIATLAARCRFPDCRHDTEPRCAVREAVASGRLEPERLEHYRELEREARAYERRHDVRLRRQSERLWGRLSDEVAHLRRWKGGKP